MGSGGSDAVNKCPLVDKTSEEIERIPLWPQSKSNWSNEEYPERAVSQQWNCLTAHIQNDVA